AGAARRRRGRPARADPAADRPTQGGGRGATHRLGATVEDERIVARRERHRTLSARLLRMPMGEGRLPPLPCAIGRKGGPRLAFGKRPGRAWARGGPPRPRSEPAGGRRKRRWEAPPRRPLGAVIAPDAVPAGPRRALAARFPPRTPSLGHRGALG